MGQAEIQGRLQLPCIHIRRIPACFTVCSCRSPAWDSILIGSVPAAPAKRQAQVFGMPSTNGTKLSLNLMMFTVADTV